MTIEAFSQILDGLAFLLVTPEFLGGEKIQQVRSRLIRVYAVLRRFDKRAKAEGEYIRGSLWFVFVFGAVVAFASFGFATEPHKSVFEYLMFAFLVLADIIVLVFAMALFLKLVTSLLVRAAAFGLGATCFFFSRGMMIWFTWHHG
jgi:Na+/proline symporter